MGAPLADDIGRVLSENLTAMIPSDRVVQLPLSAAVPIDYEIQEIIKLSNRPTASSTLLPAGLCLGTAAGGW